MKKHWIFALFLTLLLLSSCARSRPDTIQPQSSGASDSDNMDEFAWHITQNRFDDAAKYLHPTLYDALNGDLTEKVDSNTMGIFGTTPVGICPDYCSVESNETIEAKLWGQ